MTPGWTSRDLDIVETLTRRVRLLTTEQVARIWWPGQGSLRTVRRRMKRLTAGGLLARTIVNVHPLLKVQRPLQSWYPGQPEPNFEQGSQRAQNRWGQPAQPTEVYWPTAVAANLFGSTARRLPDLNHRDHDLLLGQVYVLYRTKRRHEVDQWIGEDALGKAGYGIKDPDAFLLDKTGSPWRVIESAGRYNAAQVESFHHHCAERELPYELW